jgi:hypothetical protein
MAAAEDVWELLMRRAGDSPAGNGSGDVIIERRLKDSMNMMLLEAAAKT